MQFIADREGFETHLSKEFLSFGNYEREIDAKDNLNAIANRFKIPSKSLKILTTQTTLITEPYLWDKAFEEILAVARRDGILIETKILESVISDEEKTKNQVVEVKQQGFTLKNAKAMSYYTQKNASTEESASFLEHTLKDKQDFIFEKKIITKENEIFVKVKDKNLYFSDRDIIMQELKETEAERAKRIKEYLFEEELEELK